MSRVPEPPQPGELSRRERQIMDVLFERDGATAAEVRAGIPEPPSYSAVRALLARLEDKGHVLHGVDGPRYVYRPAARKEAARAGALTRLVRTFFGGSVPAAIAGLLGAQREALTDEELDALEAMIRDARERRAREDRG